MAAVSSLYVLFQCYVILQCSVNIVNFQLIYEISTEKSTAFFLKNNDTSDPSTSNEGSHQIFYIPCFLHIWYDIGLNILHLYYHKYI